ncbi:hypothetical protein [Pseudomonas brassicacearum]|uniref:hypothetical protein n=1 Tax=Pseudomonas brassicacearum TaxID=930166 RepID=UPI001E1081D3|nr:hypothetical protein [Pseudomonas brassicacearum]CAH0127941.1 hypothetical protein SRABI06_00147 [Pseudomonas brassicacearum]
MQISTKNWTAQIDRMPGAASFRTFGTVTVANSGVTPILVRSDKQDKSFDLRLDLKLQDSDGVSLQVLTDKFVEYKELGDSHVSSVSIYFEDQLLHTINEVKITH